MNTHRTDDQLHIIGRWLEYEGEVRVGLLRVGLVATFYAAELLHFGVFAERTEAVETFHRQVTYIAAGWLFLSLAVLVAVTRNWLPSWLKYLTSALDVTLLTLTCAIGSGAASPLAMAFPMVVVLAALRGNLRLILFTTLIAMGGHELLVGLRDPVWFDADHVTPPIQQIVAQLVIGGCGLIAGQMIRMHQQVTREVLMRPTTLPVAASTPAGSTHAAEPQGKESSHG